MENQETILWSQHHKLFFIMIQNKMLGGANMYFYSSKSSVKIIATFAILLILVLIAIGLILFFPTKGQPEKDEKPVFYAEKSDAHEIKPPIALSDYYLTKKTNLINSYYIDNDLVLWGRGFNDHGQLGMGEISEDSMEASVRIAENVVSVDCSNAYSFCIYLTADGNLYGVGENPWGIFTPEVSSPDTFQSYDDITSPVLLMENVSYARAAQEAVVLLKNDGSVWWWGRFAGSYLSSETNREHSSDLCCSTPEKVLEDCVYVTAGNDIAAAITADGDLYTWGLNVFGQCGYPVTSDDYVREPQKVLENVHMVWPEKIEYSSTFDSFSSSGNNLASYPYNTFVQLQNSTILAAGLGLEGKEKKTAISGDLSAEGSYFYSDTFLPIRLKEDSYKDTQDVLDQLKPGMALEEVTRYLCDNGIQYDYSFDYNNGEYISNFEELILRHIDYRLYFNKNNEFVEVK